MLEYGGLTINTMVPKEIVTILQALIIIIIISISHFTEKILSGKKHFAVMNAG
jgi:ABC-type uncharacterized transport system permease subunit